MAESFSHKKVDNPNIDDLAEASINLKIKEENVFLFALFSGLSGGIFDKEVAANTLDAIKKIADPEFVSLIGWRDSIVTFVRTHSKVTISMLTRIGAHPTYNQIKWFINKLKPQFNSIYDQDVITTFDNEQKLKKSYRLGGEEGSNKMTTSLCTMVLHLYPHEKSYLQFQSSLSPAKWLWNKLPSISDYSKTFSKVLQGVPQKMHPRSVFFKK